MNDNERDSRIDISKTRRGHRLVCEIRLDHPIDEVFAFFSNAGNLDRLTPPHLRFEILTAQPIEMSVGTLIDYRLRLRGLPIRWQSEITAWDPPHRFIDEQRRGPYRHWIHEHRFIEESGATRVIDEVQYGVHFAPLIHALFIRRDLQNIFAFRSHALTQLFATKRSIEANSLNQPA